MESSGRGSWWKGNPEVRRDRGVDSGEGVSKNGVSGSDAPSWKKLPEQLPWKRQEKREEERVRNTTRDAAQENSQSHDVKN